MKTFNTLLRVAIAALMILGFGQLSMAQILNDDLESGNDPIDNNNGIYFSDFTTGSGPSHYIYDNEILDFFGNGGNRFDHTLGTAEGHMLIYDGFDDREEDQVVWRTTVDLIPSFTYTFSFWGRNRFSGNQNRDVTLQLRLNGNFVDNFDIPEQAAWEPFNIPISGGGAGSVLEIVQVAGEQGPGNDFALDDFLIDCVCEQPQPTMSVNGSSNYSVNVCSEEELFATASANINCENMNHFFGIQNLDNNQINGAWLTASEAQDLMSGNLSLQDFASSTHANPWGGSTTFNLHPGTCYEVKYAAQTACFVWEAVIQQICILEEGECDCTVNSFFNEVSEYPDGPRYLQTNSSIGNNMVIIQYSMDFGDGSPIEWSTNSTTFEHNYAGGSYNACLTTYAVNTLTGDCCSDVYCRTINVAGGADPEPWPYDEGDFKSATFEQNNSSSPESAVIVAPNPNDGQMQLLINADKDVKSANIKLLDQAGRLISEVTKDKAMEKGMNIFYLNETDLTPGVYLLKVEMDGKPQTKKVVIQ